jgi:hypothetical protein
MKKLINISLIILCISSACYLWNAQLDVECERHEARLNEMEVKFILHVADDLKYRTQQEEDNSILHDKFYENIQVINEARARRDEVMK